MAKKPQHDETRGRSHIRVLNELLRSASYQDLSVAARALLFEFMTLLTANNNGELFLSIRVACKRLHCSPGKVSSAFNELSSHGFLLQRKQDHYQSGKAREWQLTFKSYRGHPPLDGWKKWEQGKTVYKINRTRAYVKKSSISKGDTLPCQTVTRSTRNYKSVSNRATVEGIPEPNNNDLQHGEI